MQVSRLPQILFFFLFFFIFLFFFLFAFPFFLPASGIAGTEVPVCCKPDQNNVVWSFWDIKRRRFGFFIFFFKPIQNNVVLDLSHLSKRRRFELPQSKTTSFWTTRVFKKKTILASKTTLFCTRKGQNDVVLAAEP